MCPNLAFGFLVTSLILALPSPSWGQAATGRLFDFQSAVSPFQMRYMLHEPPGGTGGQELFPLVVYLHGAGGASAPEVEVPITGLWEATQMPQYASYLVTPQRPGSPNWGPENPADLTLEIVDQLVADLPIDRNRIYITGPSAGGFGSARYASAFPERFAAAVPIAGGDLAGDQAALASLPAWSFHGSRDKIVSVEWTRRFSEVLMEAGAPLRHTEFPLSGHEIWDRVYNDHVTREFGLYPWLFSHALPHAQRESTTVVSRRASWTYLDDGSDQGTAWRDPQFDDAQWPEGLSPLGYGDQESPFGEPYPDTTVNCGPNAPVCDRNNYATTYFRHDFLLDQVPNFETLTLWLERNDAAAVYLNGVEIFRDTELRPDAAYNYFTRVPTPSDYTTALPIDPRTLVAGRNVLAVEVHLGRPISRELSLGVWIKGRLAVIPEPTTGYAALVLLMGLANLRSRTFPR